MAAIFYFMKYKGPGVKIMIDFRTADDEFRYRLLKEVKTEISNFLYDQKNAWRARMCWERGDLIVRAITWSLDKNNFPFYMFYANKEMFDDIVQQSFDLLIDSFKITGAFMENPNGCADSYIIKTSEILAKKFTIKYTL